MKQADIHNHCYYEDRNGRRCYIYSIDTAKKTANIHTEFTGSIGTSYETESVTLAALSKRFVKRVPRPATPLRIKLGDINELCYCRMCVRIKQEFEELARSKPRAASK